MLPYHVQKVCKNKRRIEKALTCGGNIVQHRHQPCGKRQFGEKMEKLQEIKSILAFQESVKVMVFSCVGL